MSQNCALTPALRKLLLASVEAKTTRDKDLAAILHLSPATIKTQFKRIGLLLETRDRFESIMVAWERGCINQALPSSKDAEITAIEAQNVPNRGIAHR